MQSGLLGTLDVRPEVVPYHRRGRWSIDSQTPEGSSIEGWTWLARNNRALARGELQPSHKRPCIEGEPATLEPVPVSGESDEGGSGHQVVKRLLEQGVGPLLAQVAHQHRLGCPACRMPGSSSTELQILQIAEGRRRHKGRNAPISRVLDDVSSGEGGGEYLLG